MARYFRNRIYSCSVSTGSTAQRVDHQRGQSDQSSDSSRFIASRGPAYYWRLVLIGLIILSIGVHVGWNKHVSAQTASAKRSQNVALIASPAKTEIFKSQISQLQATNPLVELCVVVATDKLGVVSLGDRNVYSAASIGKLITAVSYLHLVDSKQASLSQLIDGHNTLYWLNLKLVKSDDVTWQNLNSFVTHASLMTYAASIGLTQYDADNDNFPAADAAILLYKLQNGTLLSSSSQQLMLGWLAAANYRSYIVQDVLSGSTVYHKVGFDGDNLHDAAIIRHGDKSLVLVIFTNGHGNYDWDARVRLIQIIRRDAQSAYL